jgi:hypothetical protein
MEGITTTARFLLHTIQQQYILVRRMSKNLGSSELYATYQDPLCNDINKTIKCTASQVQIPQCKLGCLTLRLGGAYVH